MNALSMDPLNTGSNDTLVKSWNLSNGKVNVFLTRGRIIRANIEQRDGKIVCISSVLGLQKDWIASSTILKGILSDAYATLSQSSNREFFLRIALRIRGGGGGESKVSSSSDATDQSSRPESQKDMPVIPDKQEELKKQESDQISQENSEESSPEQRNPSPSDFHQYSTKKTGRDVVEVVVKEIIGNVTGLGTITSLLECEELNNGENEWVVETELKRMGINESDLQRAAEVALEDHKQDEEVSLEDHKQDEEVSLEDHKQDYAQDADLGRFDKSDFDYNTQEREPVERHSDYNMREPAGGYDDASNFRDNMRDRQESLNQ